MIDSCQSWSVSVLRVPVPIILCHVLYEPVLPCHFSKNGFVKLTKDFWKVKSKWNGDPSNLIQKIQHTFKCIAKCTGWKSSMLKSRNLLKTANPELDKSFSKCIFSSAKITRFDKTSFEVWTCNNRNSQNKTSIKIPVKTKIGIMCTPALTREPFRCIFWKKSLMFLKKILAQSGLLGFFDSPWSDWPWINVRTQRPLAQPDKRVFWDQRQ